MENFIKEEVKEVLDILKHTGNELRIGTILAPAVINILWALTSGSRISRTDKRLDILLKLLDKRSKAFDMAGGTLSQFPFMRFLAPRQTGYYLIKDLNKQLSGLLQEVISHHMNDWSEEKSNDDLIYSFITEMKKNEGHVSTFTGMRIYRYEYILCILHRHLREHEKNDHRLKSLQKIGYSFCAICSYLFS